MCVFSFLRHLTGQREKNEIPNLLGKRFPTEFFFPLTPPRGTRRTLPRQRPIGPRPIFPFSLYPTSWHRAEVPDVLPNRPIFLSYTTSWYILFLFSLFFFFALPRCTEQKSPTHCSKRSPTDLCFLFLSFSYTTSWHIFLFFIPPRSTEHRRIAKNGPQQL